MMNPEEVPIGIRSETNEPIMPTEPEVNDIMTSNMKDEQEVSSQKKQESLPLEALDISRYHLDDSGVHKDSKAEDQASAEESQADPSHPEDEATRRETQDQDGDKEDESSSTLHDSSEAEEQQSAEGEEDEENLYLLSAGIENAVAAWNENSSRHESADAFKNGFVLPVLMLLEFDVFDPDSVIPFKNGKGYHIKTETQDYLLLLDEHEEIENAEEAKTFLLLDKDGYAMGVGESVLERGELHELAASKYIGYFRNMGRPAQDIVKILKISDSERMKITKALQSVLEESDEIIARISERLGRSQGHIPFVDIKIRRVLSDL